mgnify:FL=1
MRELIVMGLWLIGLLITMLLMRWIFKIEKIVRLQEQQVFLLKKLVREKSNENE